MRSSDIAEIRKLPLFKDVSEDNFARLMRGAYMQTFPPFVDLITEGDSSDFLHIVFEGSIELYAQWNGRESTLGTLRPISTFILAATIKDAPYLMSARTLEKSRVILLPSADVRETFLRDQDFSRAIVDELATCYRTTVKYSKNIKLRNSVERLANYLLRKNKAFGNANVYELPIEKRRLASFLRMTPENLSRSLKTLRDHGAEVDGNTVRISNLEKLSEFSKPTPLIDDPDC